MRNIMTVYALRRVMRGIVVTGVGPVNTRVITNARLIRSKEVKNYETRNQNARR
jgi:hypothetical protein